MPEPEAALSEHEAAAQISALIAPSTPPKGADGRFQARNPQPDPEPQAEPEEEQQPVAEEAPQQQAAPDDEDIEIDVEDEAEAAKPSSLEMPASWGQTAREYWESFTPEQQQFLAQHDAKRTSGLSREANQLKAAQDQLKAQTEAIQNQQLQLAQAAQRLQTDAVKRFQAKFGDVTNVSKLATENPARFIEYQAAVMEVQASMQEAASWQQAIQQKQLSELSDFRRAENEKLAERFGLDDETKANAFQERITKFTAPLGIDMNRLAQYTAEEIAMVHDAMKYRAAVAKRQSVEKAQPVKPPKVIKPGAPVTGSSLAAQSVQQLSEKLKKTGSDKDAAALLKARWARASR